MKRNNQQLRVPSLRLLLPRLHRADCPPPEAVRSPRAFFAINLPHLHRPSLPTFSRWGATPIARTRVEQESNREHPTLTLSEGALSGSLCPPHAATTPHLTPFPISGHSLRDLVYQCPLTHAIRRPEWILARMAPPGSIPRRQARRAIHRLREVTEDANYQDLNSCISALVTSHAVQHTYLRL